MRYKSELLRSPIGSREYRGSRSRPSWTEGFLEASGLIVPASIVTLLPKCSVCLAAYIALGTGFGLSISSTYLRWLLVIACAAALCYLSARYLRPFLTRTFVERRKS
jgi:hypothetical protein